ncbi:hypothetical protein MHYP_G00073890 [Metynnis hypsauchen]
MQDCNLARPSAVRERTGRIWTLMRRSTPSISRRGGARKPLSVSSHAHTESVSMATRRVPNTSLQRRLAVGPSDGSRSCCAEPPRCREPEVPLDPAGLSYDARDRRGSRAFDFSLKASELRFGARERERRARVTPPPCTPLPRPSPHGSPWRRAEAQKTDRDDSPFPQTLHNFVRVHDRDGPPQVRDARGVLLAPSCLSRLLEKPDGARSSNESPEK